VVTPRGLDHPTGANAAGDINREALPRALVDAFTLVQKLPKTATGKIQKCVLRGRGAAISCQ